MKNLKNNLVVKLHNISEDVMNMASNRFICLKGREPTNQELEDIFYISEIKYIAIKDPDLNKSFITKTHNTSLNNDDDDDDDYIPDNSNLDEEEEEANKYYKKHYTIRRKPLTENIIRKKIIKKCSIYRKERSNHQAKTIVPSKVNNAGQRYFPCPHCPKVCFHAPAAIAHIKSCPCTPASWNIHKYLKPI